MREAQLEAMSVEAAALQVGNRKAGVFPAKSSLAEPREAETGADREQQSLLYAITPAEELSMAQVKEFLVGTKKRFEHLAHMAAGSAQDVEDVLTRLGL